jgi:GTP pyrophosphokinase
VRFFEIVDQILSYYPRADITLLEKAYVFAAQMHRGQTRLGGEPYLNHPLGVAGILAGMRLDEGSLAAALIHDALEERHATEDELGALFGKDITGIVKGVTKLAQLDFSNRKDRQAEYMRKMVLAMSHDIRVVLVKLADRLHDMRWHRSHGIQARQVLGQETLDIYAPLAARLGIDWMKQELEDLAFECLEPKAYAEIVDGLAKTEKDRRIYIDEVKGILEAALGEQDIQGRVIGRPKHIHGIHLKMMRQQIDLNRVYDLTAFRIIVDSIKACYEALGMVHSLWEPLPGRYKDYIARPKANMYQSLHTTVLGPRGEKVEVQIRTEEMNRIAREGIAAHWLYKEGRPPARGAEEETQRFSWLRELLEWNREWRDPKAIFDNMKMELYPDEIYVFTPQGEVKALPRGAIPVDFAYEVHTEVGHRCVGARVNGKLVPLRHELANGDAVEILTSSQHRPSKDWLKLVKSPKALSRIRHWFKNEERERCVAEGREICEREFRKRGLHFNHYVNSPELLEVARSFAVKSIDDLLASIGYKKVSPIQVIGRLPLASGEGEAPREESITVEKSRSRSRGEGVAVLGASDLLVRMARCCHPVPGEPIVGYITRGKGITVHRQSCSNLGRGDTERKIDVQWDTGDGQLYTVDIQVVYAGDRGVLANLNGVLGQLDVNVVDLHMDSAPKDEIHACRLRIEVKDTEHLHRVLTSLRRERGIYRVQRIG